MALIQEDNPSHNSRHVLHRPSRNSDASSDSDSESNAHCTAPPVAADTVPASSLKDSISASVLATPSAHSPNPTTQTLLPTQDASVATPRPVDRNWARVRQKMIGSNGVAHTHLVSQVLQSKAPGNAVNGSAIQQQQQPHQPSQRQQSQYSDLKNQLPLSSTLRHSSGVSGDQYRALEASGAVSTGIRGVLGFRTVVVQRTQLRRMEKEIEKALARHAGDYTQPRSRTVGRMGTATRGMIPGATYSLMVAQEPSTPDRFLIDELSDVLVRWKSLVVDIPFKTDILRTLSKMLQANRPEPLSRTDSAAALALFDQMRQMFPLKGDPEDLQDVIWCLNLLSPKYACKKDRVMATIQDLLNPKNLMATVPLSQRNIKTVLAPLIKLLSEQARLPQETQDGRLQRFATELMERIRIGDLGVSSDVPGDRPSQEHYSQVAFLTGLIECLRLRDMDAIQYLIHELIPEYWLEPVSKYPRTMDEPAMILGQIASEFVLSAPVEFANGSESTRLFIQDLMLFLGEFLTPAELSGSISKDSVAMLVRFVLSVFSIQYLEDQQQEKPSMMNTTALTEDREATPRTSISTEGDREIISRTPPRTPLSPNISGEHFQARSLPPHVPNIIVDEHSNPVVQRARVYFDALWHNGYRDLIVEQLKSEMETISFQRLINLYYRVILGSSNATSSLILSATLTTFFSKLVAHQPEPNERLSKLLLQLSVLHRTAFFKPMIACVASDSTQFVTDYLCILSCLEVHMGLVDLYMRDADMICVIAMTDVGPERPRTDSPTQALKWGSCTVGQCVIVLEFIYAIKRLARSGDKYHVEVGKMFLIDLERKLGLYLLSKEKNILVPRPMRVLLCMIFYEIRMLCKTIHRPGWLPRILDWTINRNITSGGGIAQGGPHGFSETMRLRIKHIYSSVDSLVGERKEWYTLKIVNNEMQSNRNNKEDWAKSIENAAPKAKVFVQPKRLGRMPDIKMDESVAVLKLLITVHSAIHVSEYLRLVEPLWNVYCLESRTKVASSAAFLFVKCADIAPKTIHTLISRDLVSDDPFKRLSAVERLSGLFDHRNELLLQPYVIDPSTRGPFRNAIVQVPFVPSEIGSNRYTMDEPRWLTELKSVGNFPVDIRVRLEELGWGERDRVEREMTRRSQTPLMLSWTGYMDEDYEGKANFGRVNTVNPRDRHATVVIPVLNSLNLATIDMLEDTAVGVRTAAINFLSDYIRNEPVLFVRWLFAEIVHARPDRRRDLVLRMHLLLSAGSKLPPAFAFTLFNHLLGLLKWCQRNSKPLGAEIMAPFLSLLADVVSSTNDIVFKDFKRNKIDVFFANLGRFWFRPNIAPEFIFPNRLSDRGNVLPLLGIPHQLFQMAVVNTNQIQFMTSFLVRFPQEISDVKNSIGRFNRMPELGSTDGRGGLKLEDNQYLPDVTKERVRFVSTMSRQDQSMRGLSSLRARAWLCFILNLIQRMDKSNTDRLELTSIFNGVNVILLEHGDDLGVTGQVLDVYVTAATHLRRFFASQSGYALIFPALFKIYCDSTTTRVVHETIDAAFYRFYLLHQEAFVLQSLGAVVPLILRNMSDEQSAIMARCLFDFLEALDQPATTYYSKALGISSLAEPYHESGSYGGPQLEIPEWMTSFISRDSKLFKSSSVLHKGEFSIADAIKLFLAVIAFDPGSIRSEQFVRPLVPPSFTPPCVAPRQAQDTDGNTCDMSRFAIFPSPFSKSQAVKGKTWAQNDRVAIKHEFICLIQQFCNRGGQLADSQHQQMATLIRSIIKDYISLKIPCTTEWIKDYIRDVILSVHSVRQGCRALLYLVVQFSNTFKAHFKSIDFSGYLDGLRLVAKDDRYYMRASMELANMVRERVISQGLALSVKGDWITDCAHISQARFCNSLVDLMLSMITNADVDTLAELESATPTPRFMAYIIIPTCLRFKSRTRSTGLDILEMQFWLRMLGLTIKAAEYDPTLRRSSRAAGLLAPMLNVARASRRRSSFELTIPMSPQQHAPSTPFPPSATITPQTPGLSRIPTQSVKDDLLEEDQHQKPESTMNASPGLLVDFIALRIIIVRGELYLSYHPGCWLDIFNVAKKYFSAHGFLASSFSGPIPSRHARQNSSTGSGPSSPNMLSPFPLSPRLDGPRTPDLRQGGGGGGLSPFPGFFRSFNEVTPFPGSTHSRENVPTTALGYILWTFAETILYNRLPLMIMMRPFLLDQLRLVQDYQPQSSSARPTRSASSSGPNSPAFYWPSPSVPPFHQPAMGSSPLTSPLHFRTNSGPSDTRGSASVKEQQRSERRKQWKSWSRPPQTMSASTAVEKSMHGLRMPMSPQSFSVGHQRQRSVVSTTSEHEGNMPSTPRIAIHHIRSGRHHRSESDANKSEHTLPKILVERAKQSTENVRAMLAMSSDSTTAYSVPMYPEKRSSSFSSGLSPSMARHDRRDSSQFSLAELGPGNDHHFLQPGKYEPQPSSPGFGSMFLAREAALRAPSHQIPDVTVPGPSSSQPSITLTVPSTVFEGNRLTLNTASSDKAMPSPKGSFDNNDDGHRIAFGSPPQLTPTLTIGEPSTPVSPLTQASTATPALGPKKARSILKPRIITTAPPKVDSNTELRTSTQLTSASHQTPNRQTHRGTHPIRRADSGVPEDTASLASGKMSIDKQPSNWTVDSEECVVALAQARRSTFLQNIEEEARIVLSCFPSVFSIGFASPPSPSPVSAPVATESLVQPTEMVVESEISHPATQATTPPQQSEGTSILQQNEQARISTSSLSVPTRRTPSITIQDQLYLAPSPINPLPSALNGGEHLFRTASRDRSESEDVAIHYKDKDHSKERRSKSVFFQRTMAMDPLNSSGAHSGGSAPSWHPAALATAAAATATTTTPLPARIGPPPALSITLSSPPPALSPSTSTTRRILSFSAPMGIHSMTTVVEADPAAGSTSMFAIHITPSPVDEPTGPNELQVPSPVLGMNSGRVGLGLHVGAGEESKLEAGSEDGNQGEVP
ncbi:hypothetical protein BGZ98_002776 [Dissophora globulifera]|nr:hypothetical protein BGZ98_002776 [Dissophora globulifera]